MDGINTSTVALQAVQSAAFAALSVLSFFLVLDSIGLSIGPFRPDAMLLALFMGLTLGTVVFLYVVNLSYLVFSLTVLVAVPVGVFGYAFLLHGQAGVESPPIRVFLVIIYGALLLGCGLGVGSKHIKGRFGRTGGL